MIDSKYLEKLKEIVSIVDSGDSSYNLFLNIIRSLLKYIDYLHSQINHYQVIESHDKWATLEASKAWAILTDKNYWDLREKNSAVSEAVAIKKKLIEMCRDVEKNMDEKQKIQNQFLHYLGFQWQGSGRTITCVRDLYEIRPDGYGRYLLIYKDKLIRRHETMIEAIVHLIELDKLRWHNEPV